MRNLFLSIFVFVSFQSGAALADPERAEWFSSPLTRIRDHINAQKFSSEDARLDYIRKLIIDHTEHNIDEWHNLHAFNTTYVISLFWKRLKEQIRIDRKEPGKENKVFKSHLSCGPRAYLLRAILSSLGIDSLVVYLLNTKAGDTLATHTFLDVQTSAGWQLMDPDMNLFYVNKETRSRVTALEVVMARPEDYEPCTKEDECGWEKTSQSNLRDYFGALVYDVKRYNALGKNYLVVNKSRVDLEKTYPSDEGNDIVGLAKKRYGVDHVYIVQEPQKP